MNKIICFDVNGTLVKENSWEIFTYGKKDVEKEIEEVFLSYYKKEIPIDEMWKRMVVSLKNTGRANRRFIENCWDVTSTFKEGAEEIIKYLKGKEYKIYLISCSIDAYLDCLVQKLNLDGFYAGSHLIFDGKGELENITSECIKSREYKELRLRELADKEGVNINDIIFVGDGDNDIGAFKLVKRGIAIDTNNEELLRCAWKKIDSLWQIQDIL
ncbi:MAG: HAD-IB family phosphatase [Candidatus Paceibacterota bacterium]|jgi:phosphoserine phosphatase